MNLASAAVAGALALSSVLATGAPAGAKTLVDIDKCAVEDANAGQCTMIVVTPGVYTLSIHSWDADYASASLSCTDGTFLYVWIEAGQSDYASGSISRGTCTLSMQSTGATADAYV